MYLPSKSNKQKINFLLTSWRSLTKMSCKFFRPLNNEVNSVPDPRRFGMDPVTNHALFFSGCQDAFLRTVLLTLGIFTSLFKDNKSWRGHKTIEIKVFLNFFCLLMEGSASVQLITDPDGPKLTDPTDLLHWLRPVTSSTGKTSSCKHCRINDGPEYGS